MNSLPCPICRSSATETVITLPCGNLDGSTLYPEVHLTQCTCCQHSYNDLRPHEIKGLSTYYNKEYAPTNLRSVVTTGDLPGSSSIFTQERYSQLFSLLEAYVKRESRILDVGCAVGGFLDFLMKKGFTELYGVEPTRDYLELARQNGFEVREGHAEAMGYEEGSFDVLVVEQVMEHLVEPVRAFKEAARVLKPGGILCVGVPDASRYNEFYYFDFYWILMREHIQHFNVESLSRLATQQGFELVGVQQTALPIMGASMVMPNLSVCFRYTSVVPKITSAPTSSSQNFMQKYICKELESLNKKRARIDAVVRSETPVYVWGIGREFLYLYEAAGLKRAKIVGLIDLNPFKQQHARVDGMTVASPEILNIAGENTALFICAVAHRDKIIQSLESQAYLGRVLDL
jgi:SAM-dependent methyltransferase